MLRLELRVLTIALTGRCEMTDAERGGEVAISLVS